MNAEDKREYIERYRARLRQYGVDPRTLGWGGGRDRQAIRFRALADIGIGMHDSVLDVGCGFCDLYGFLRAAGWRGDYLGIDINAELLVAARDVYPDARSRVFDLTEEMLGERFDWVFGSGLFNAKLVTADNLSHIREIVTRMFGVAKRGVACDFMSTYVDFQHATAFHLDPADGIRVAKSLSDRVIVRMDYLRYEFMLYIFASDAPWPAVGPALVFPSSTGGARAPG